MQVSRGRLLSHMLNLVTLPTGLYYARGLILIFRMAAMATRPSSFYTYICFPEPRVLHRNEKEGSVSTRCVPSFDPSSNLSSTTKSLTTIPYWDTASIELELSRRMLDYLFLFISSRVCKHAVLLRDLSFISRKTNGCTTFDRFRGGQLISDERDTQKYEENNTGGEMLGYFSTPSEATRG